MKWFILIAVLISQGCLGSLYAWSAFVPALQNSYALSATQGQIIFGGMIVTNTLVMIVAGRLLNRCGPRNLVVTGGILFGSGYMLAGFSGGNFITLFLGVALLVGCAIGFGYVTLLITIMRWFPQRQGLASGIAVAGFGGGAIFISYAAEKMMTLGFDVLDVFNYLALAGGFTIILAGLIMKFPPGHSSSSPKTSRLKLSLLMKDRRLWMLFLAMFAGTFTGLAVIGNLKPAALTAGLSSSLATAAVGIFAAGNASGRILWGWLIDLFGEKTIPVNLLLLSAATIGIVISQNSIFFLFFSFLVGICFGASFVIYATYISQKYGAEKTGDIYPLVFLSQGLSGITGPASGGIAYDLTGTYSPALLGAALLGILAGIFFLINGVGKETVEEVEVNC